MAFKKDFIRNDENKDIILTPIALGEYFGPWKTVSLAAGLDFSIFVTWDQTGKQ